MNLYYAEKQQRDIFNSLHLWILLWLLTTLCQTLMQGHMGTGVIITVRMLKSSQIEMSSHSPFVWMVLHFYHSHLEPVWPNCSRSGCMPPVNSQPSVICLRSYDCMSVTKVMRPQGFCHVVHHLYSLLFVWFLYICFSSDNAYAWFFTDLCRIRSPFAFCKWLVA